MDQRLRAAYQAAIDLTMFEDGDELIVLPKNWRAQLPVDVTDIPGVQEDDGVAAVAAIDLVRHAAQIYEDQRADS
jgi:hypothetical protein